jgi:hypothetical protein
MKRSDKIKKYYDDYIKQTKIEKKATIEDSELNGIGGWLIIVAILVFIRPFLELILDFNYYAVQIDATAPNWSLFLKLEILFTILFDYFLFYQLYLFIKKKKFFPVLFIRLVYIQFIWLFLMLVLHYIIFGDIANFDFGFDTGPLFSPQPVDGSQVLYSLIIWVPYMYKSVRVKNTFIN